MAINIGNGQYDSDKSEIIYEVALPTPGSMPVPPVPPPFPPHGIIGPTGPEGPTGPIGPHGHLGEMGPTGPHGKDMRPLGAFDDIFDLPISDVEIGDTYIVGRDLYIYEGEGQGDDDTPGKAWYNYGEVSAGAIGPTGATGENALHLVIEQNPVVSIDASISNISRAVNHCYLTSGSERLENVVYTVEATPRDPQVHHPTDQLVSWLTTNNILEIVHDDFLNVPLAICGYAIDVTIKASINDVEVATGKFSFTKSIVGPQGQVGPVGPTGEGIPQVNLPAVESLTLNNDGKLVFTNPQTQKYGIVALDADYKFYYGSMDVSESAINLFSQLPTALIDELTGADSNVVTNITWNKTAFVVVYPKDKVLSVGSMTQSGIQITLPYVDVFTNTYNVRYWYAASAIDTPIFISSLNINM